MSHAKRVTKDNRKWFSGHFSTEFHSPRSSSSGMERERIGRVNREVCRGRGDNKNEESYDKDNDHELPYYDAEAKFCINNGLSEENCQTTPLGKAKRVVFDRCSFLRRTGKVPNQFN